MWPSERKVLYVRAYSSFLSAEFLNLRRKLIKLRRKLVKLRRSFINTSEGKHVFDRKKRTFLPSPCNFSSMCSFLSTLFMKKRIALCVRTILLKLFGFLLCETCFTLMFSHGANGL